MSPRRWERICRALLRCYPRAWRRHREEEMISTLLDLAESEPHLDLRTAVDLVGHGVEERVETGLRWLPHPVREQVAWLALAVGSGLALVLLGNEVLGAGARPPAGELDQFPYLSTGPFLTLGVGLYLGWLLGAGLFVAGRGGWTRVAVAASTVYAAALFGPVLSVYPRPRLVILALFLSLGLLTVLATVRPTVRRGRWLPVVIAATVATTASAAVFLAYGPSWDLIDGIDFGYDNSELVTLALALRALILAGLPAALLVTRRHPGWLLAAAVVALPLIGFSAVAEVVGGGPNHTRTVLAVPVLYGIAVLVVLLAYRAGRRRALPSPSPNA